MSPYRFTAAVTVSALGFGLALGCNGFVAGEAAEPVAAAPQAECTTPLVTAVIDQKGGVLKVPEGNPLFGARLQIPPDALTASTSVTLYAGDDLTAQGAGLSQTVCISINDRSEQALPVTLAKAAALVLPYDAAQVSNITTDRINHLAIGERTSDSARPVPMPGLTVVDEPHRLLAAELRHPGRYLAITRGSGELASNPNLDVLFVLDSSGSMTPKQNAIAKSFVSVPTRPGFFKQVTRYDDPVFKDCIDYHIGITTTDVGRDAAGKGDDGQLQAQSCLQKANLGTANAKAVCQDNCNPMTPGLPTNEKFIARRMGISPETQEAQFACMAIVGDVGSGEESPLESIHRTIARQRVTPDTVLGSKFLRTDGLTAMVILTDEDDCSMANRAEFYNPTIPCNAADPGQASCYNDTNSRCLGVSLKCDPGELMTMSGNKTGCKSRTGAGTILTPAKDYADDLRTFITATGNGNLGRTGKPGTLYLFGAWPLAQNATTFETSISFSLDTANPPPSNTLGTHAFCYDPATLMTPEPILGHPQVRLNEFALAISNTATPMMALPQVTAASICRESEREHLLAKLADSITTAPMVCTKSLAP